MGISPKILKQAEIFADALDASAAEPERVPSAPVIPLVTNIEMIQKFMTDEDM